MTGKSQSRPNSLFEKQGNHLAVAGILVALNRPVQFDGAAAADGTRVKPRRRREAVAYGIAFATRLLRAMLLSRKSQKNPMFFAKSEHAFAFVHGVSLVILRSEGNEF